MKRRHSFRDILLLTIAALTLVITLLSTREVVREWRQLIRIQSLKHATVLSDQLFDTMEKLSVERDIAFAMLHAQDEKVATDLQPRLDEARLRTQQTFNSTLASLKQYDFPETTALYEKIKIYSQHIQKMQQEIDAALALDESRAKKDLADRWRDEVALLTQQTQTLWMDFIKRFTDINPNVAQHLRFKQLLRVITDYAGRERSAVGRMIVENTNPTPKEIQQLMYGRGFIEMSWIMSSMLADHSGLYPAILPVYKDAKSHYLMMSDMVRDTFFNNDARSDGSYPISADLWFELSTQAMESLQALNDAALMESRRYIDAIEADARKAIALHTLLFLLALGLCVYSFHIIIYQVIQPINRMIEALVSATQGKPVSVALPKGQDEISKLANVLDVFQSNVDQIKRTSEQLESYVHALERSNRELDDFAYIASHDLKEPLRGIHNHSRFVLEDNEGKLDPESVQKLKRLVHLSQRMEALVNDLLYFSRLGRQELAIQPTNLNDAIRDIESTLDVFLAEHHARIVIPKPLPVITCDKVRVTEVFRNLITNAVKYNDKPEKTVEIGCLDKYASPRGETHRHVFYIKDNGKGIAPEFHEEIFRIFRRLQQRKENEAEGTGVGLTFVKKIIERHNGKIWLESTPGKGTTFYFTLKGEEHAFASAA